MTQQEAVAFLEKWKGSLNELILAIDALAGPSPPPAGGQKRLWLAVGTNYRGTTAQLGGCVNDVLMWEHFAVKQSYSMMKLLDHAASRKAILDALTSLIEEPNALLVFSYSGHGTSVPDRSGDEQDGRDEALVPDDFRKSGVILDDELGAIYDRLAPGSRLLVIHDCCHSGTINRNPGPALFGTFETPRYLEWDPTIPLVPTDRSRTRGTGDRVMQLAACQDNQTAADTGKAGAFTLALYDTMEKLRLASAFSSPSGTGDGAIATASAALSAKGFAQRPVAIGGSMSLSDWFA